MRGRYLLGLLAPYGEPVDPQELEELATADDADPEGGSVEASAPVSRSTPSMLPSSIGLTFSIAREAEAIEVSAHWGHYQRVEQPSEGEEDAGRLVWQRRPAGSTTTLPLAEGTLGPWPPDPASPDVYVRGLCRPRDDAWIVTLFLVNGQESPKQNKDEAWLFQPELSVREAAGRPLFLKRALPTSREALQENLDDGLMAMLYRREVEFAVGHGIAVHAERPAGQWARASRLVTQVMPTHDVERMEPPSEADQPQLRAVVLDMAALAALPDEGFAAALTPLADAYEQWIAAREGELANPAPDLAPFAEALLGREALTRCRDTLARLRDGIARLGQEPQAAAAFRFANHAMAQQRIRTLFTERVRRGESPDLATLDEPRHRSWRPFQLAFVLLNIGPLADPSHPKRGELADLLWFPTGGGKTEAYLGVAAFALAIRRLQGVIGGVDGRAGVTVLMRYTLRLLTLQQFQRATTLIAACELARRADPARWGDEPFRIGLWVGLRSTPNRTDQAAEAIKRQRGNAAPTSYSGSVGGSGTPAQLTNCPWCGKALDPGKSIVVDTDRGRTLQYCSDPYGQCPFSRRQSPDEGLPILVVDEEIYRHLPALLIATVDKFAQMPWKGATQMLFGQVTGRCPRHGYSSPELACGTHPRKGKLPATRLEAAGPLRPPDLIIQDELHLISGPLGTLVGLYESAVDRLCQWELDGQTIRPKVIASTATIRRASDQVQALFAREIHLFPPSGLLADDNFFARRRPASEAAPSRRYLGICAPGVRLKTVLIRVYVAQMAAAQALFNEVGEQADPWMTLVGYFSSMRELGGMRRVTDDAVRTRLQQMDRRGLAKRLISYHRVEELTSRRSAEEIPRLLDRLEARFPSDKNEHHQALDVLLATNMISVGVDVARLGAMVVAGQPKATAEYIQATSRVGRRFPGLVCTVYNWARPRDLSHYERFEHYHATFYQQVEALSVTPFAARALDRGLAGVLVALIRLLGERFNADGAAHQVERDHSLVQDALAALADRAGAVTQQQDERATVRLRAEARLDEWLRQRDNLERATLAYNPGRSDQHARLLVRPEDQAWAPFTCLNSLRDVEPASALILDDREMDQRPPTRPGRSQA